MSIAASIDDATQAAGPELASGVGLVEAVGDEVEHRVAAVGPEFFFFLDATVDLLDRRLDVIGKPCRRYSSYRIRLLWFLKEPCELATWAWGVPVSFLSGVPNSVSRCSMAVIKRSTWPLHNHCAQSR
ncbi:MAG: hypothetical protein IT427_01600 [Pirellulales bacterium]|nr:hypothetical protein [Pirellulales bacterium]